MPLDPKKLPRDPETLQKIVVDLAGQLDRESTEKNKYRDMLRELLDAQRARKSERLTKEQAELFEAAWRERETEEDPHAEDGDDDAGPPASGANGDKTQPEKKLAVRHRLAKHLTRERIVHDLSEADKHCAYCGKDLRLIAEDTSVSRRIHRTSAALRPHKRGPVRPTRIRSTTHFSNRAAVSPGSGAGCTHADIFIRLWNRTSAVWDRRCI